ncbi:MAG TPA: DnaB-like helicase C-terminal domain-containing protein [Methanosarcina sp.]|nr:DnaB-like helicase C-terminal domain-containing protein [Methanosarcina sp.]
MATDYNVELQRLFLEMMMQDAQSYVRVQNIYNPDNFDRSLREAAKFLKKHSEDFKTLPTYEQIKAVTGVELQPIPAALDSHQEWFLQEFEGFSRRRELERAVLKAADLIEDGEYDPVEKLIKDAVQISLTKDMGTDYFESPSTRLSKYFDNGGQMSTGWPQVDRLLFGGFSRGELNIFAGGSGSGKSLVMMNLALNWLQQGLSGVYITLELSEELVGLRTDAMLTGMSTKDIRKDMENAELKIKLTSKKTGQYRIKGMPAQSNINDIRAYIKEVQIQTGIKIDFIMVDYLDLLMPVSAKVSPNDLFVKDKYVSEELRNLAKELNVLFVTASQLNRSAVEEIEFDHSHISGGISKINTADNVFGIFTSRAMKERGRYQIQCMKSRSSTGVGMKVDLEYNIETMRITDPGLDATESASGNGGFNKPTNILSKIKGTTSVTSEDDAPPPGSSAESTQLKKMLASLKSKSE